MSNAAQIVASFSAGAGSSGLMEILGGAKQALVDEPSEALIRAFKLAMARKFFFGQLFVGAFDSVNDAKPSFSIGISPAGLIDIFDAMINASVVLSALIGEEMAEELLLELLQEGASNAIQYSIGGAFQTMYNIYRGAMTLYSDDIQQIPNLVGIMDDKINIYNLASAGNNILATLHYLIFGALDSTERNYVDAGQQIQTLLTRVIDENLWLHYTYLEYARQYLLASIRVQASVASMYVDYASTMVETAIARLNDKLNELMTVKKDLENDIITPDQADAVRQSLQEEYNVLKQETDEAINNIIDKIMQLTIEIPQDAVNYYNDALDRLASVVGSAIDTINQDFVSQLSQLFEKIMDYMDGLLAYRFYLDYGEYPENAPDVYKWFALQPPEYYELTVKVVGEA